MGLFSGSTKTSSSSTFDSGPSSFQNAYLTNAFDAAQGIYDNSKDTPYYQGETYAGMSDEAKQALSALKGYAGTTGLNTATQMSSLGSNLTGYGTSAGTAANGLFKMASADPTQANIASATAYANNPAIDGMIDAASRDVSRNLNEQELPSIDRAASATGNINSSRAGVASGIAQRGAADRIGDISSQIRGDAYDKGLSLAEQARSTNMSGLNSAAGAYGNLSSLGLSALGQGATQGYNAYGQINSANSADQTDRQGQDTANFNQWQGQDQRASDLLSRYMGVVGANQWGQSGTSSTTSTQKGSSSLLGQLLGGAALGAGIFKSLSPTGAAE